MIILDNSVLVAYTKPTEGHHLDAVQIVADNKGNLGANALTVAEFMVYPVRLGTVESAYAQLTGDPADGHLGIEVLDGLGRAWPVHLARVRARTGLKMPDAVVLATATHVKGQVATFDDKLREAARAEGVLYEPRSPETP